MSNTSAGDPLTSNSAVAAIPARRSGELFGHPTCLFTLFFAEMWERFSFYGMKALLILYMVNYLFWHQGDASTVMAWYAGLVYATPIVGGIIADKWIGARWAVVIGGVIIAIGHFLLAFEPMPFFFSGLACLVVGTGFLKPNISTQVGALYRSDDERRDSAFTIFYMGINLGAFIGPLVCGWLRLRYDYHYGFAAAGVGMVLGLIVYIVGMGSVVRRERQIRAEEAADASKDESTNPTPGDTPPTTAAVAAPAKDMSRIYFDRCIVLIVICVFAILFWVGFEQAANVMNLWADKHTNLFVFRSTAPEATLPGVETAADTQPAPAGGGMVNWQLSAEMTQSINPLFIIIFAGIFAWLWQFLERHKRQPSTPMKMLFGVFFLTCAYGIMLMAAQAENRQTQAPLFALPAGFDVDEDSRVFRIPDEDDAKDRTYYGAKRLTWKNGDLIMNGVLTDLDWTRALGDSAPELYVQTITDLKKLAEERDEEVRAAKRAGTMERDAEWQVETTVPAEIGELEFIAGLPDHDGNVVVSWDPETRTLVVTDTLSDRDRAQLLAGGADPSFRQAITSIYKDASVVKVSILWLLAFYLVLTIGELCISPVGLSLVTKAAPAQYVGLFMGFWFLTTGAVSNYLAHFAGGYWGTMTPGHYFIIFGILGVIATVIMSLLLRVLKPMLHGIH